MKILVVASLEIKNLWTPIFDELGAEVIHKANAKELSMNGPEVASCQWILVHRELCGLLPDETIEWAKGLKNQKWILISRQWEDQDFKSHSQTPFAAQAYFKETEVEHKLVSWLKGNHRLPKIPSLKLEDFKETLTRPDIVRPDFTTQNLKLEAPQILFRPVMDPEVLMPETLVPETLVPEVSAMDTTMMIQATRQIEVVHEPSFAVASAVVPSIVAATHHVPELPQNTVENIVKSNEAESLLALEKIRNVELQRMVQQLEHKLSAYRTDQHVEHDTLLKQNEDLHEQLKEKTEKLKGIEVRLQQTIEEVDRIKDRVKIDIRRIRVREKELENQLEFAKKDSTVLVAARDEKITQLKRKLDLLEFNMELVQEQIQKERETSDQLRQRLNNVSAAMRKADGLLKD